MRPFTSTSESEVSRGWTRDGIRESASHNLLVADWLMMTAETRSSSASVPLS